ncbi:SDR family NAD(P)-dependent oxidoreductase [Spirosoma jeollabukense]
MKTVLITGANKGIGLETAKQLLQQGYYVFLASRDPQRGQAAIDHLQGLGFTQFEFIQLDVTDSASIQAAHHSLGHKIQALDALVNNAGVPSRMPQTPLETDFADYKRVIDTNYLGAVHVTQAFMSLLQQSPHPRIVNVSSSLGSLTLQSDPSWKYYGVMPASYVPSKAALNAYTVVLAYHLRDTPLKINAVDTGFPATDLNNHAGTETVETAAGRIVKAVLIGPDGPSGQFFSDDSGPETGLISW